MPPHGVMVAGFPNRQRSTTLHNIAKFTNERVKRGFGSSSTEDLDAELDRLKQSVSPDIFDKLAEVLGKKIDSQVPEENKSVIVVEKSETVPVENRDHVPATAITPREESMVRSETFQSPFATAVESPDRLESVLAQGQIREQQVIGPMAPPLM
eukprot:2604861-Amphidinium_carterae.1